MESRPIFIHLPHLHPPNTRVWGSVFGFAEQDGPVHDPFRASDRNSVVWPNVGPDSTNPLPTAEALGKNLLRASGAPEIGKRTTKFILVPATIIRHYSLSFGVALALLACMRTSILPAGHL
ncbi:uncharacterized protein LOC125774773 [Anopheles funestus]|uniref:uncharacterized protein LOC125774773 n=1 Tax=Anopheles funestus TaxID=62324 RepID=UPI0020C66007|nr:uncharacterized protein LOC125774773 [Anopheles funestus]